jgi:hypothetical protein
VTDWNEIICHVCAATGWTWQTVLDEVDLPRLESLNKYWKKFPPLHVMVRRLLPRDDSTGNTLTNETTSAEEMAQFKAAFPKH